MSKREERGRGGRERRKKQHKHVFQAFTLFFTCEKWPFPEYFYSFLLTKHFKELKNVHDFPITEVFMVDFPGDVIMSPGLLL